METVIRHANWSRSTHWFAWTMAVLLPVSWAVPALGKNQVDSPNSSAVAAGNRVAVARVAGPEVWLCAGERVADLLRPEAQWPFVKQHLAGIKLYVDQINQAQPEQLAALVRLVQENSYQVAVELGGCLDFAPMDYTAGEWSARHELAKIAKFYAAGGQVDFLDLDGPIRRLMYPEKRPDGRHFDAIEKAADELVDALRLHTQAHPQTRFWLLSNFPNWGWRGDVSYHARGPQRQDYGDDDTAVRMVLRKLGAAGIPLAGITVDNPYDYLVGEHRSVNLRDPKSVDWLKRVRSYEDFAREQGLEFNLIVNSERGGQESDERFCRETLQMVDLYRQAGGQPTRWFVQSWYSHPEQMVPETAPHSMTALVKAVLEQVGPGAATPSRGRIVLQPQPGAMQVTARVPGLDNQAFALGIPETIGCREAMLVNFPEAKIEWQGPDADGAVSCSWGPGGRISYSLRLTPAADYVDVEMTVRNHTEFFWHDVFAFDCLNPTGAPDFKDWTLERTYMSSQGRPLCLARTQRVRGHMPTVGFYLPDRVETGRESVFVRGFGATSPNRTDGSWIVTLSQPEGSYMAAAVVDTAFLFDNLDRCCIHAAPGFGDIGPGQTGTAVSRFYLAKGSLEDFLKRYGADRPDLASRQKAASLPTAREQRIAAARERGNSRPTTRQQGDSNAPGREASRYSLNAKFEPPAGRVVHAMGQWEQYNAKLLPLLPAELRPMSKLIFIEIGDTPRGWRPEGIRATMQRYDQEGFIPSIDIAPRGNQPGQAALATRADPLFGIDHEVASTSRFDGRIRDLVRIVKEYGKPVIVRIGGEFNGRWNGYHPYAYPKAFRKIVEMFRAAQVDNAAFVWCYEPAAAGDFDERNAAGEYKWFPGDDVIDWFSIDWFNKEDFTGPLSGSRQGESVMTAHGRSRRFLDMAVVHQKPVMIAESAPCRYDLADPAQAEAAWQEWFEPYFAIIAERPEIKWFHLISYDWSRASYFAQTGWKNNDFTVSDALLQRLAAELRKPKYLHAGDKTLLKDYSRFTSPAPTPSSSDAERPARSPTPPVRPTVAEAARSPSDKRAELAKFDEPAAHLPAQGPGGTEWDAQYRSFIQSDQNALSKGFPGHTEAARQIQADAAKDPAHLHKHKGWVLFIKHYSQAYRPPEATEALRKLYQDLVEMEFTGSAATADLPFAGGARLTIHRDVLYGKTHPDVQRLDAYLVKSTQPTPVLIEIHGGGWRRGSKSQFVYQGNLMEAVLAAGISVVSIDYRLTPEHRLPAQMEDVVRAAQFVRSRAKDWNIDPNRIAATGGSAGAHLAAWVGLHDDLAKPDSADPIERLSSRLTCFVALSGPMDLLRVDPRTLARAGVRGESFADAFVAAVGATPEQFMTDPDIRRRLKEASPLFLVSSDDPPALVVGAGPAETALVPPTVPATINDPHSAWHGALLADALRRAGVKVITRLGPDMGKDPQADASAIVDFLKEHLGRADLQSGR